jgi:putative spermidine/putrescine transport system permease protein
MSKLKRGGNGFGIVLNCVVAVIFLYLLTPTIIVAIISCSGATYLQFPPPSLSVQWYRNYFANPVWMDATFQSLRIAAATSALSLLIGVPLALGLTRARFFGRGVLERLVSSPMMVPDIVLAIAIYGLYFQLGLVGRWYGISVAHTVMALPVVSVVLVGGLRGYDNSIELAARGLGASRLRAVWHVTLPLVAPSVMVAALFAFVVSFNELVVAIFSSGAIMTFPKFMYEEIMTEVDPTIAAASMIEMLVVFALVLVIVCLARRGVFRHRGVARDRS